MARVAAEFNLSETAFLEPRKPGVYGLRWLTPAAEVDLCGHATLAAAHALFEKDEVLRDSIVFQTRSGELIASKTADGGARNAADGSMAKIS